MKKTNIIKSVIGLGLAGIILTTSSCGGCERKYDSWNYESITNEKGSLELYSGGKAVKKFDEVKIIYSDADSQAIMFESNGKTLYWQGDALIKLK